ncbi:endonuclease reverse transcriptase [Colletotrichum incanum]|nr:endonuclease reverse transcriptase [Colletotrichum incanum]
MHAVSTGPSESALSLQGSSYATVASQPITRKQDEPTSAKQAANRAASKDLRIFARLPPESPLRNERAYDIYIFVREKLSPQTREALKGIDHVKTGLALLPSSADGAKVLLDNGEQIAALLQAQAATTKLKPEKAYFSRKDEAERLGTVTAWFKAEAVRQLPRRLRLMGASVFVNLQFPKERRSPQCHRCVVKGVVQRRNKAQPRAIRAEGERSWRFATQQSHQQSREGGEEMDCNQANEGHQENAALAAHALDMLAQQLTDGLGEALTASTRRGFGRGPGRPHWDENCRRKHRAYTTKRATVARLCALGVECQWERNEEDALKQDFLHQLRHSKDTYWRGKIAAASTGKDVFEMVGWHKATGSFQTPPLRDGSNPATVISRPKEKRDLFAHVLFRNAAISADTPAVSPGPRLEAKLPFPHVTKDEVQTSIFSAGSTTPGSDGITTAVLKTAWPVIEDIVFSLYSGCIREGWHPTCFKEAILVILPKPGKRDRALPRSYRPIALLSVLGKGLERLVARRLAWITVKHRILHDQQFGALPLRSCSDLVAAAIHNIECAWQRGLVTFMLTLGIKGAFDAVLPGRLIRHLRRQGWPKNLVQWVSSFVLGRRARIRLDGEMGDVFDLECGLPQGSPVSPILFMLYIEPLFKLGTVHPCRKRSRFGYADNIAILASSTSLEDNCALLAKEWEEAQEWGANPPITVRLLDGRQHTVQAVNQGASLRWLGVHFDRRLTFKNHREAALPQQR